MVVIVVERYSVVEGVAEVCRRLVQLRIALTISCHIAYLYLLVAHIAVETIYRCGFIHAYCSDGCAYAETAVAVGHQS